MNDTELWQELKTVFISVFNRSDFELGPTTTARDIPYWDSLNHVQLILTVESHFKVRFKHSEVAAFDTVGDLFDTLKRRLQPDAP